MQEVREFALAIAQLPFPTATSWFGDIFACILCILRLLWPLVIHTHSVGPFGFYIAPVTFVFFTYDITCPACCTSLLISSATTFVCFVFLLCGLLEVSTRGARSWLVDQLRTSAYFPLSPHTPLRMAYSVVAAGWVASLPLLWVVDPGPGATLLLVGGVAIFAVILPLVLARPLLFFMYQRACQPRPGPSLLWGLVGFAFAVAVYYNAVVSPGIVIAPLLPALGPALHTLGWVCAAIAPLAECPAFVNSPQPVTFFFLSLADPVLWFGILQSLPALVQSSVAWVSWL